MPPSGVPLLGVRIREERLHRGISLRGLARQVGVSASMLSQIETGKAQPSVSTLYAVTSALGISVEEVFAPASAAETQSRERTGSASAASRVSAPGERQTLTLDTGVTWERLGELDGVAADFLRITYPPGSSSSSGGGLMRHAGAEYGFVLCGELVLTLGFEEVRLGAGDAVSFESSTPHSYRNDGDEAAVGVWFVVERDLQLGGVRVGDDVVGAVGRGNLLRLPKPN